MKDYIQKTLAEIDEQIAALEELRDGIKRHFEKDAKARQERPAVQPVPAQETRATKKAARKPRKKVKESDLEGKSEEDGPIRIGSVQHKVLVEARKFPDPFTAEKIAAAMGIDKTAAGSTLFILAKKGLIEEVGKDGMMKTYVVKNG